MVAREVENVGTASRERGGFSARKWLRHQQNEAVHFKNLSSKGAPGCEANGCGGEVDSDLAGVLVVIG
jgi:hypothetical protein